MKTSRKQWTDKAMSEAVEYVRQGGGLREGLYNVPHETLRRRVQGVVEMGCKPTVLTDQEEEQLA